MNIDHSPMPIAIMTARMKPLPRRHRIAHLRALIGVPALDRTRREELAALLRAEMALEHAGDLGNGDRVA